VLGDEVFFAKESRRWSAARCLRIVISRLPSVRTERASQRRESWLARPFPAEVIVPGEGRGEVPRGGGQSRHGQPRG